MVVRVTILGAGLCGLYAAWRLIQRRDLDLKITILERDREVGGLCRSFAYKDIHFDLGSHRLHPSCRPEILDDLKQLLGNDLLQRPRKGRIHMLGRFLDFPLNFTNLSMNCPPSFTMGVARDTLSRILKPRKVISDSFKGTMLALMGKTISEHFYFPIARKMWDLEPEQISGNQALVRTKSSGLNELLFRIIADFFSQSRKRRGFYYPKKGVGQIASVIVRELERCGVTIYRGIDITGIHYGERGVQEIRAIRDGDESLSLSTDLVFSTIPISRMIDLLSPAPGCVRGADVKPLTFRSILFLFMVFPISQFTPFDAHYFPEKQYCFTRISEPKNYSGSSLPEETTGLCVEIPCGPDHEVVHMSTEDLETKIRQELLAAGLPLPTETKAVFRRFVPDTYPIYHMGYEQTKRKYLKMVSDIKGLISLGRCGLFVHDNMHHTMAMASDAVGCIEPGGGWNPIKWEECLRNFERFVVED